jgi:hypothetical protein
MKKKLLRVTDWHEIDDEGMPGRLVSFNETGSDFPPKGTIFVPVKGKGFSQISGFGSENSLPMTEMWTSDLIASIAKAASIAVKPSALFHLLMTSGVHIESS